MAETVLVIAAHPDDEVLGCGGTMARHADAGDAVHVVIMAEGVTSRDRTRDRDRRCVELSRLGSAAKKANDILGTTCLHLLDFPDNRMDSMSRLEIVKVVEDFIDDIHPSIIYTQHGGDLNVDHRRVHEAVVIACRPKPGNQWVRSLLSFEVASSTEWQIPGSAPLFAPNWYVDISDTLDKKIKALEAYGDEIFAWPNARSIPSVTHLARWRGANVGVDAAEAFIVGRHMRLKSSGDSGTG